MICLMCRQADLVEGSTSVILERQETKIVVINVPALSCPLCGEAIMDEDVVVRLLSAAERVVLMGMRDNALEYGDIGN